MKTFGWTMDHLDKDYDYNTLPTKTLKVCQKIWTDILFFFMALLLIYHSFKHSGRYSPLSKSTKVLSKTILTNFVRIFHLILLWHHREINGRPKWSPCQLPFHAESSRLKQCRVLQTHSDFSILIWFVYLPKTETNVSLEKWRNSSQSSKAAAVWMTDATKVSWGCYTSSATPNSHGDSQGAGGVFDLCEVT